MWDGAGREGGIQGKEMLPRTSPRMQCRTCESVVEERKLADRKKRRDREMQAVEGSATRAED